MGIIETLAMAAWANARNPRVIPVSTAFIDDNTSENLILIGGADIIRSAFTNQERMSLAGEIKTDTARYAVRHAIRNGRGVVSFYDRNHRPGFPEPHPDSIVFGRNASYVPLNSLPYGITKERINVYFERIVKYHCRENAVNAAAISGILRMYIDILAGIGISRVNVDNIEKLVKCGNESDYESFPEKVMELTGKAMPKSWENYCILNWENSQKEFLEFWRKYKDSLEQYAVPGSAPQHSLCSAMIASRRPCVCGLDTSSEFLKVTLLSELEMIYGDVPGGVMLIDYCVPLPVDNDHRFFSDIYMCMIGDSLKKLGIEQGIMRNPTLDCLGLNANDAADVINYLVSTHDMWRVGVGGAPMESGALHAHLNMEVKKILEETRLAFGSVHDGSSVRIQSGNIYQVARLRALD